MDIAKLERACGQMSWGNVVLFLGAGFTLGARNLLNEPVLSGKGLTSRFLSLAGIVDGDNVYDLQSSAEEYIKAKDSDIVKLLIDNFTISKPSDLHCRLARHNYRRIYTTNYDNCFHVAATSIGSSCVELDLRDKPDERRPDLNTVIHIHGMITNITNDNFEQQFYVTEPVARPIPFTVGSMVTHFRNDLIASDWIIFIGYSLADPHIKTLLADSGSAIRAKTLFIGHPSDPVPLRRRFEGYGDYYDIGLLGLIDAMERAPLQPRGASPIPNNFREVVFRGPAGSIDAARMNVRDEFLIGTLDNANFDQRTEFSKKNPFYAQRTLPSVDRPVCIHGDTGNGKSVMVKQLAYSLWSEGFRILEYIGGEIEPAALSRYVEGGGMFAIIVEDVVGKLTGLNNMRHLDKNLVKFLMTAKTKDWEIRKYDIVRAVGGEIQPRDVNKLRSEEISDIVRVLDDNFLWGDRSNFDHSRKIFLIKESCRGEFRGVLFALFDGGSVRNRIDQIFSAVHRLNSDYFDIMCLNCIFSYSRLRNKTYFSSLGNLDDLLDLRVDFSDFHHALRRVGIEELFDLSTGEFSIRSAILSKYFVSNHLTISGVLSLSLRCLKNIESYLFQEDEIYNDLAKALLQFNLYRELFSSNEVDASTKLLISSDNFHNEMFAFYEKCKEMRIAKNDPMFVIQLSKSHLHQEDFASCYELVRVAEKMFRPNGDKYQLETHHAEVMLREIRKIGEYDNFRRELEAFNLLKGVIDRRNDGYHPFGVISILLDIIDRDLEQLIKKGCDRFAGVLDQIISLCDRFPNELHARYSVVSRVSARARKLLAKDRDLRKRR